MIVGTMESKVGCVGGGAGGVGVCYRRWGLWEAR